MNEADIANGGAAAGGLITFIILIAILLLYIVSVWKIFTKAGKPGWACLIPIYNFIVFLEVVGRPIWWIILMLIPFVNIIIILILCLDLAKSFGKSAAFGVFMFLFTIFLGLPIFQVIIGLGSSTYQGPSAAQA